MLRTLKRTVGRARRKLWLLFNSESSEGQEKPGSYYDARFKQSANFKAPFYKSSYYATWIIVVDRLRRYGCKKILDIGCGPGQFADLCDDWGFESYFGIDFSTVALDAAKAQVPRFQYRAGDVREKTTYEGVDCDSVVCMEVLEHIEADFAVIACFPTGRRCLMTVPNFPWQSHVRHFESEQAVVDRYGKWFDDFTVTRIKGTRDDHEQFYLMDGVRNSLVPNIVAPAENG